VGGKDWHTPLKDVNGGREGEDVSKNGGTHDLRLVPSITWDSERKV
jgi:hypothetical protein